MENNDKPMKLNDEQRKIVEENHKLIYWYCRERKLDVDEWYDILSIALCVTVLKHDDSRGVLSTHFKVRADCAIKNEYRYRTAKKRVQNELEYMDNLTNVKSNFNVEEEFLLNEIFGEYADVLTLKLQGKNQRQIAKELGISQSQVSNILRRAKSELSKTNKG